MTCDHLEWVYPAPVQNDWTGEMEPGTPYQQTIQVDLDIGRFQCPRCKEVGYYTGQWKRYFEEGIPCAGSDRVPRHGTPRADPGHNKPER